MLPVGLVKSRNLQVRVRPPTSSSICDSHIQVQSLVRPCPTAISDAPPSFHHFPCVTLSPSGGASAQLSSALSSMRLRKVLLLHLVQRLPIERNKPSLHHGSNPAARHPILLLKEFLHPVTSSGVISTENIRQFGDAVSRISRNSELCIR